MDRYFIFTMSSLVLMAVAVASAAYRTIDPISRSLCVMGVIGATVAIVACALTRGKLPATKRRSSAICFVVSDMVALLMLLVKHG